MDFPVTGETFFELEDQLPTQGIIYHSGLGVILMIVGAIMGVEFNLNKIFWAAFSRLVPDSL